MLNLYSTLIIIMHQPKVLCRPHQCPNCTGGCSNASYISSDSQIKGQSTGQNESRAKFTVKPLMSKEIFW